MDTSVAEPAFGIVLAVAIGVPVVAAVLGLFLQPLQSLLLGGALVVTAAAALRDGVDRLLAAVLGVVAVLLGGGGVPIVVIRMFRPGAVPEVVALLTTVVFLVTMLALHVTAFAARPTTEL
ncbi:hypothetical protein [Halorarius litoreus]|uniref:hypothetical protein n=1 Tax=Halorarius litoreus TaxID=2962676 RepID=UPI0020CD0AA6|nr:hypothetical protein [Halorarius litoreus]